MTTASSNGSSSYISELRDCIRLKNLEKGRVVHRLLHRHGLLRNSPSLCSAMVDMYAKCGSVSTAQELFDTLPGQNRDVVTWTALISGHAQTEDGGHRALESFKRMQIEGVCPNAFTFSCILKACGGVGATDVGKELHAALFYLGLSISHPFVASALVCMYAKCGCIGEAETAFFAVPVRDEFVWTALISGYVDCEHGRDALKCFEQMRMDDVSPSAVTYACVLKACAIVGDIETGKVMHGNVVKTSILFGDIVVGNSLIDMYAKCGFLTEAQEVFDQIEAPNIVSWTALIAGYADHEFGDEAYICFIKMQENGMSPDAYTFSCCLKACGNVGTAMKGEAVHADIRRDEFLTKNLVVGTALVDMYAKCGLLDKALSVFDELSNRDNVLWNTLLTGYSLYGYTKHALCIFDRMRADGYEPHLATFVSIMNSCTHAGLVENGQYCFQNMQTEFGILPHLDHHTCMADLYSRAGRFEEVVAILNLSPCHPSMAMLLTILGACRKSNNVEVGLYVFQLALGLNNQRSTPYMGMQTLYAEGGMCMTKDQFYCHQTRMFRATKNA